MANDLKDISEKYAVPGSEEEATDMKNKLVEGGYDNVQGTTIIDKEKIWQYLEETKPAVIIAHYPAEETGTAVKSALFVLDYEQADKHSGLQHLIMGAMGDDVKNLARYELFIKTALGGLKAGEDHEALYSMLMGIMRMSQEDVDSVSAKARRAVNKALN